MHCSVNRCLAQLFTVSAYAIVGNPRPLKPLEALRQIPQCCLYYTVNCAVPDWDPSLNNDTTYQSQQRRSAGKSQVGPRVPVKSRKQESKKVPETKKEYERRPEKTQEQQDCRNDQDDQMMNPNAMRNDRH